MWMSRKVIFLSASEATPNRARNNPALRSDARRFLELGAFLVWLECEVDENSADEDPKGDDR